MAQSNLHGSFLSTRYQMLPYSRFTWTFYFVSTVFSVMLFYLCTVTHTIIAYVSPAFVNPQEQCLDSYLRCVRRLMS